MQRLTYPDFLLFAQRKHQGGNSLRIIHLLLQLLVDQVRAGFFDQGQVHRFVRFMAGYLVQVFVQPFRKEWRNRSHQFGQSNQALVQSLVSRNFIVGVISLPEAATAEAHVPVAQVFIHKLHDLAGSVGGFVVGVIGIYFVHQRVQRGEHPTVNFGTFPHRDIRFNVAELVDVGVQRKEGVGIVECAKELALRFFDARQVKAQVVPHLGVGDHVPTGSVGTVFGYSFKRIRRVAEALGHLLAVFVQYQTVRNHVFERHTVEYHHGDGVERIKPAPRLVNAFGDEVSRVAEFEFFYIFKRVMPLCIRH